MQSSQLDTGNERYDKIFSCLFFQTLSVEYNLIPEGKEALLSLMKSKGYLVYMTLIKPYTNDIIFVKKGVLNSSVEANHKEKKIYNLDFRHVLKGGFITDAWHFRIYYSAVFRQYFQLSRQMYVFYCCIFIFKKINTVNHDTLLSKRRHIDICELSVTSVVSIK